MKKILLSTIFCFFAAWLSAQYVYKIKADSVLITNDSCTAELNLENRTKDTLGFLYNKGKGRTEFRRMVKKIDSVTYVIGGVDTIKTGGSSIGNYIFNQYAAKQNARAWIDTLKSVTLISDTLRTKIIDAGGFGTAFVPDLNTGVWIRPKSDDNTTAPYFQYESANPQLAVGHSNNNFGTDSSWQNSTPLYVYRTMLNNNQARMNGSLYGWGKNNIYGYNLVPAGVFKSSMLLDTSSTTYTFQGNGIDFNGNVLEVIYGIGASKDVSGVIKFDAGSSPPHALRIAADFNPYYTPTQQYDGFWYNALSHLRYGGGPNSYIDRFAHYYAQPFVKQTGYGHIKSGYAFYAGGLYQDGVDRAWGFYSEGANDRNYFAGQTMIGDTTVANAGTNKLYVNGNSKISGSSELGNYLKLGNLSSDPTGSNGMMYYNTTSNRLKGYFNSTWQSVLTSGDIQNGLIYNSSTNKLEWGGTSYSDGKLIRDTYINTYDGSTDRKLIINTGTSANNGGLFLQVDRTNGAMFRAEANGFNGQTPTVLRIGNFDTNGNDASESNNTSLLTTQEILNNGWGTNGRFKGMVVRLNGSNLDNNYNLTGLEINTRHHYTNSVNVNGTAGNIALKLTANSVGGQGWLKALTYAIYADSGRVYSRDSVMFGTTTPGAFFHVNGTSRFDLGSDATGDIFYRNSSGLFTRLPIGTSGQVLTVSGGLPTWAAASGGGSGLGDPSSNGIVARTALNTTTARTITGTTNEISISNGDGVSSNPTISLPSTLALAGKSVTVQDDNFTVQDNGDNTKKFKFEAGNIPASTTITLTSPPVTSTLVSYKTTSEISNAAPVPTGDAKSNEHYITALAANATFSAPSGALTNGNRLIIRIKDNGTARTLNWNGVYRGGSDIALPTSTIVGKTMYLGFMYNSTDSKWDLIAYVNNL